MIFSLKRKTKTKCLGCSGYGIFSDTGNTLEPCKICGSVHPDYFTQSYVKEQRLFLKKITIGNLIRNFLYE